MHVGVAAGATQNFYSSVFHELVISAARGAQLFLMAVGYQAMALWTTVGGPPESSQRRFLIQSMAALLPVWWLSVAFYGWKNGEAAADVVIAGSMLFGFARYVFHDVVGDAWLVFSIFVFLATFPLLARFVSSWRRGLWLAVAGYAVWNIWLKVAGALGVPNEHDFFFLFPLSNYFAFAVGVCIWQCENCGLFAQVRRHGGALFAWDVATALAIWEFSANRSSHVLGSIPVAMVAAAIFLQTPFFGGLGGWKMLRRFGKCAFPLLLAHVWVLNIVAKHAPDYFPEGFIYLPAETRVFLYLPAVLIGSGLLAWPVQVFWVAPFVRLSRWWIDRKTSCGARPDLFGDEGRLTARLVRSAMSRVCTLTYTQGLYWALILMFFGAVFDPMGGLYRIKYGAFAALIGFAAWSAYRGQLRRVSVPYAMFWAAFSLCIPGYGLFRTFVNSGALEVGPETVYLTAGAFLGYALLLTEREHVQIALDALDRVLMLMVWGVLFAACLILLHCGAPILGFLWDHNVASPGFREYGGIKVFNIYFYSAPMLMLPTARRWSEYFDRPSGGQLRLALACSAALLLTGTRACMALGIVAPLIVWAWRRFDLSRALLVLGVGGGLFVLLASAFGVFDAMLSTSEQSNAIKLGYLAHYAKLYSIPDVALFGQGFNAAVWSPDYRGMLNGDSKVTELAYLEILRVYGFGVGGLLWLLLCAPILLWAKLPAQWRYCAIGWFLFLVVSLTNPYIVSSTGMTLYGVVSAAVVWSIWPKRQPASDSQADKALGAVL